jgi:hypothetical protein
MSMKRTVVVAITLVLLAGMASAGTVKQLWTAGWDYFGEPLNYTKSNVQWSVSTSRKLTVTVNLVGATPLKLYQASLNFFCSTFPANFGQFPTEENGDGTCISLTRQGVTATVAEVEIGVITTDSTGKGSYKIVIGPVPAGTYELEFFVRNGAGCDFINGGPCDVNHAEADFQSPGPFGTYTIITVP